MSILPSEFLITARYKPKWSRAVNNTEDIRRWIDVSFDQVDTFQFPSVPPFPVPHDTVGAG